MAGRLTQGLVAVTLAASLPVAALLVLGPVLDPAPRFGIAVLLVGAAALAAYLAIDRLVVRPLSRLRSTAARLRDGHLDERIEPEGMPAEFGAVAQALNEMALKLRIIQQGMEHIVRARTADLKASEARFRTIVTAIREYAIYMLDPDGRVATWNEGAEALKGYTKEEIIGKPFEVLYPQIERERGVPQTVLETAREAGSVELEGWRIHKDGSRFWADVIVTALRDGDRFLGYAAVVRDLTEQRAMETDLRRSNRDLERFAYSASHDLRQPARTVSAYLDLVSQQPLDEEATRYVERAMAAADRMQGLIDGILAYSLASRSRPTPQTVEPSVLVRELRDDLATMLEEVDATVELQDMPAVRVDPDHLRIALQNLLVNAVQYRQPGRDPLVRIAGESDGQRVRISVQDNGIGIAERHREQVFEMFQRLHPRDVHDGHGLGLALVKRVVEANGGRVEVRSKEGAGSTFVLWLPAADVEIGEPALLAAPR